MKVLKLIFIFVTVDMNLVLQLYLRAKPEKKLEYEEYFGNETLKNLQKSTLENKESMQKWLASEKRSQSRRCPGCNRRIIVSLFLK